MKRSGFQEMSPYKYPLYIVFHPKDGFQEMRANRKGSWKAACFIILCWLFVEMFYRKAADFDINPFDSQSVSLFRVSVITVMMFVMVCTSNWCFCTLLDGKGKLKDICVVGAYSLIPYIAVRFITVILSHLLTGSEQILLTYSVVVTQIWCFIMIFIGLQEIHEYSFKKTLFSILLTAVGVILMLFLMFLLVMLFQQLYYFIATVIFELKY